MENVKSKMDFAQSELDSNVDVSTYSTYVNLSSKSRFVVLVTIRRICTGASKL